MNPLIVLFLFYLLSTEKGLFGSPDTFKMELALDNMNKVVNMAQKINGLSRSAGSFHPAHALPAPSSKPGPQPYHDLPPHGSQQSNSVPDLGELMQTMGPILQMLSKGEK